MVKIERVTDDNYNSNLPPQQTKNEPTRGSQEQLSITLSRGRGTATFRPPLVSDLKVAERVQGSLKADGNFTPVFGRELARICCLSWGEGQMPTPEKIRAVDDQHAVEVMLEYLGNAVSIASENAFEEVDEGDEFFHLITLTDGSQVKLRDMTQADRQKAERSNSGLVETNCRAIASLCVAWGDKKNIAPAHLYGLGLEDYFRLQEALNGFFR